MIDCRSDLYNRLVFLLMEQGIEAEDIKGKLLKVLMGYEIMPKEESLVVYTEGKNEIYLKNFLIAKMVKGCSQRTIDYYRKTNRKVLDVIGKDVDTITSDDIKLYMAKRMLEGTSAVTINNEKRALSSFLTWLNVEEYIPKNPMIRVEKVKEEKVEKKAFTQMEIEMIRAACVNNRERAMVEILLSTAMRVSEVTSVKITDIKENGSLDIIGKGNKHRIVYMNARAQLATQNYLSERKDTNPYLFPSGITGLTKYQSIKREWYKNRDLVDKTKALDKSSLEAAIRKIGRRAGVEKTHPHRFRRTCATSALRSGMPIEMVSKMLGHANIQTTQIYLDLSEQELESMHRKFVNA